MTDHRIGATTVANGLATTDHYFTVPLDHAEPGGATITVYAREVAEPGRDTGALPWLVFLQGGPGGKAPRPADRGGWLRRATRDYRVLLLDQRGTGRSTPLNRQTLPAYGGPSEQARVLANCRADSIVADCEAIREVLSPGEPWSTLGQSFGGFCTLSYLSHAPHGLRACYITGGIPSIDATAEQVYRHTYPGVRAKNAGYFAAYPGDAKRLREIADHLQATDVRLPAGDRLTVHRLQTLGLAFGMTDGAPGVHYLLEEAWARPGEELSDTFLHEVQRATSFAAGPLFALVHEPSYGHPGSATRWAAQRVRAEFPEFDPAARDLLFTGEMIYPWMFAEYGELAPQREAAEILAAKDDWRPLYDAGVLARNEVPVAAAVYHDDMYVNRELSLQTARRVPNVRTWVTDEYEHNGLRADGERILDRLIELAAGRV